VNNVPKHEGILTAMCNGGFAIGIELVTGVEMDFVVKSVMDVLRNISVGFSGLKQNQV